MVTGDGNGAPKKRWNRQPVNKKIKRIRRNRRLRKMLIPKNALMSLNELMGSTISEYDIVPEERGFVARVYVNNVQYEGRGKCLFLFPLFSMKSSPTFFHRQLISHHHQFFHFPCRSFENCGQK